jgi:hypothetical protein
MPKCSQSVYACFGLYSVAVCFPFDNEFDQSIVSEGISGFGSAGNNVPLHTCGARERRQGLR